MQTNVSNTFQNTIIAIHRGTPLVGIGMQFKKEKKITLELLNFFKISEQEKQH